MSTYFDTSLLFKSYVLESGSDLAVALLENEAEPTPISHATVLEMTNAFQLKHFRKEITATAANRYLRAFHDDLDAGRLYFPVHDLKAVFERAAALARKHTRKLGARSMDLLHVAAAIEFGCNAFASFDARQRSVATKERLVLRPGRMPGQDQTAP